MTFLQLQVNIFEKRLKSNATLNYVFWTVFRVVYPPNLLGRQEILALNCHCTCTTELWKLWFLVIPVCTSLDTLQIHHSCTGATFSSLSEMATVTENLHCFKQ